MMHLFCGIILSFGISRDHKTIISETHETMVVCYLVWTLAIYLGNLPRKKRKKEDGVMSIFSG